MNRVLLLLALTAFKNKMLVRIRRLRSPRYAVGMVVGLAYLYLVFFRRRAASIGLLPLIMNRIREPAEVAGAFLLFLFAALVWVWPTDARPALTFTRAEVQHLFQAPITRRQLVRYKMLSSQLEAFMGSALLTIFMRPASLARGWMFLLGLLVIIAILNLHMTGVSLSRESLAKHGRAAIARQWIPPAVVLAAVLVLGGVVAADWSALARMDPADFFRELLRLATTGPAAVVLWPFRALSRLPLASSPAAFARALPAALGILLLNYFWVMRSDAAFEEASAERAEKIALRRESGRLGARASKVLPTPFPLSPQGRPEGAIVWKNLILLGRYVSPRTLIRILVFIVVIVFLLARHHGTGGAVPVIALGCLLFAIGTIIIGPQLMRNDLRQDLPQIAVLKSWPMRGGAIVRGEAAAPALALSFLVWLLLLAAAVLSSRISFLSGLPTGARISYTLSAMLATPGLLLTQLLVQNGLAVVFPGWVAIGRSRARGIDVMGQRMLLMAGMLVALVLAVLPAALLGGAVAVIYYVVAHRILILIPVAIASAALLAEAFVGAEILGRILERAEIAEAEVEE